MEHSQLVAEIPQIEKLATGERLKLARKRRQQQMKKFGDYEKKLEKGKKRKGQATGRGNNKKGNRVNFFPSVGFLEAAARNDIDEVRNFLQLEVSPDVTNEDGLTALHQCCIDDSEAMMQLLLEFNANVNARDSELWTPLHAAATCGHVHLCKHLIDKGADLLSVNSDGNMPYDLCEDEATLDYIENQMADREVSQDDIDETRAETETKMLRDCQNHINGGGDVNVTDDSGTTLMHIAAANGYMRVLELLLGNRARVDVRDQDSWQPIHAAACWGHPMAIEALVMAGADIDSLTKNGETPYDICEDHEIKQRILAIKDEMDTHGRMSETGSLKRRHSHNTRSASIRRTSMREKNDLSKKEVRKEHEFYNAIEGSQADEQEVQGGNDDARLREVAPPDKPDGGLTPEEAQFSPSPTFTSGRSPQPPSHRLHAEANGMAGSDEERAESERRRAEEEDVRRRRMEEERREQEERERRMEEERKTRLEEERKRDEERVAVAAIEATRLQEEARRKAEEEEEAKTKREEEEKKKKQEREAEDKKKKKERDAEEKKRKQERDAEEKKRKQERDAEEKKKQKQEREAEENRLKQAEEVRRKAEEAERRRREEKEQERKEEERKRWEREQEDRRREEEQAVAAAAAAASAEVSPVAAPRRKGRASEETDSSASPRGRAPPHPSDYSASPRTLREQQEALARENEAQQKLPSPQLPLTLGRSRGKAPAPPPPSGPSPSVGFGRGGGTLAELKRQRRNQMMLQRRESQTSSPTPGSPINGRLDGAPPSPSASLTRGPAVKYHFSDKSEVVGAPEEHQTKFNARSCCTVL